MKLSNLSIFFFFLFTSHFLPIHSNNDLFTCLSSSFTSQYSSNSACGPSIAIDQTSSLFPHDLKSGSYTALSIDVEFSVLQTCFSAINSRIDLFSITLSPDHANDINLFNSYILLEGGYDDYRGDINKGGSMTNFYSFGVYKVLDSSPRYNILVVTSLQISQLVAYISCPGINLGASTYSLSIDSRSRFDASTKFFVCSDSQSNAAAYCKIESFIAWYSYVGSWDWTMTGLYVAPIVNYIFNENSGYLAADSTKTLGTAYFGPSSASNPITSSDYFPKWLTDEAGIEFTEIGQYVRIPWFLMPASDPNLGGTLTISFWLKYVGNNEGFIFRFYNHQNSFDYFSLYIRDSGHLSVYMENFQSELVTDIPITFSQWKIITISVYTVQGGNSIYVYADSEQILYIWDTTYSVSTDPDDIVLLGGPRCFRGSLSNFRIFNSGTAMVSNAANCPTYPFSCPVLLGTPQQKTCLSNAISACHRSCKTCIDATEYGCLTCADGYYFSQKKCTTPTTPEKLSPATTAAIASSQAAAKAATQAVNALTAGSPSGVSAAVGGKIFSNIKFLNISYSKELEEALGSWGSSFISLGLTPDMPSSVKEKIHKGSVPSVFEKREVPSSFLVNFWENLGMLLIVFMVFSVIRALEWVSTKAKAKYLSHAVLMGIRAVVQNFVLAQLYSIYGDILLFSVLEYRSPNFSSGWSRISFASSLILVIGMLALLGAHIFLLRSYQKIKQQSNSNDSLSQFINKNKGSFVLFNDFKDYSFVRQSFLLLLTARDLMFSLLLATMFDHPLIEAVFILCLNLTMVTYLILKPPFKSVFDATQQLFYEVIALIVNICILIMAIMDEINSTGADIRSFIGKFIIATNMVFNFGSLGFMLAKAFLTCREIYQAHKTKKALKKKTFKIQQTHRFPSVKSNLDQSSLDQTISHLNLTSNHPLDEKQNETKTPPNDTLSYPQNNLDLTSLYTEGQVHHTRSRNRLLFNRKRIKLN